MLAWGWTDDEKTAVSGIVSKIKEAQAGLGGNPKLYYILSQAYHDLSKAQNVTKPFSDQAGMWKVIAAQAKTAVETCGFDGVISTGAMLQNLRTSKLNNDMGLTRDGYHMDLGIARYGASCTVFETIIGPFNGNLKLDSNSFRYSADGTHVTDANAPVALMAARYAIANPYTVTDMTGIGGEDTPTETKKISISNAEELLAFAASVNSGDSDAINAEVTLSADIDCSSITDWTPIGNCTLSSWGATSITISGNVFNGSFDGQNHSIKGLNMSFAPTKANTVCGFFGGIGDGAAVKDLTFDSTCSMSISTGVAGCFGTLAGLVKGAQIENVKNYAPVSGGGTSSLTNNAAAGRVVVGGLVGWVHPSDQNATLSKLYNAGAIGSADAPFSCGGNKGNGGNGVQLGGIAGLSTNQGNTKTATFTECVNDADIYSTAGRTSSILSAAQQYAILKNCTNNGNLYFMQGGNYRIGGITCIAAVGCSLEGCVNKGNIVSQSASAAGIICLINHDSVQMKDCSSIGADIVSSNFNLTGEQTYTGALYGQCNKKSTFSNCHVSGRVGKYSTSGTEYVTLTADNYFQYAGQANSSNSTMTSANIKFYNE